MEPNSTSQLISPYSATGRSRVSANEHGTNRAGLRSGHPARTPFWMVFASVLALAAVPAFSASTPIYLVLTVLGPDNKPVPKFEAMLHSHQHGYIGWQKGTHGKIDFWSDGVRTLYTRTDPTFQVVVRAPNLAPTVLHLENTGSWIYKTVKLTPGRLIDLSIHTANGSPLPGSVIPLMVYPEFAWRVRAMRMPENVDPRRIFDFVMSQVHRTAEGQYQFRVPDEPTSLFLAIHEPGFMRSLESGLIADEDLAKHRVEWQVPAPAKVRLQFDVSDRHDLPATQVAYAQVSSYIPEAGKYYTVWSQQYEGLSFDTSVPDLAPGRHMVRVTLMPPTQENGEGNRDAVVPAFRDKVTFDLSAGQEKTLSLDYVPFKPDAWRGDTTATVTIRHYDSKPAAEEPFTLHYIAPHYGEVPILEDMLDAQGQFQLDNVRCGPDGPEFFLRIGEQWSRRVQITEADSQAFEFTLGPQVGDSVPDVPLLDLATRAPVSLSTLRGNLIYLEFWATWCGPCKIPIIQLNNVAARQRKTWDGRVHILTASIDDSAEIVQRYVKQRGWDSIRHLWAGAGADRAFGSTVSRAFGLYSVPTAILIGTDGRIVWRGHPKDENCETQIVHLLQQSGPAPPEHATR
ncbi:MAG: TlpA family protein disulfide reductase [Phycisphaeraceae bacterium]|nr:TlpA family protein disulfide reductase [Phycisphaeraceae bacterium]